MNSNDKIRLLYIDLFCGAGGTSTGYTLRGTAEILAPR